MSSRQVFPRRNSNLSGDSKHLILTFDSLGRVSTDVNKLGTFTNTYVGVTDRLSKLAYPGGASANYLYFPNSGDKRLQQIKNLTSANKNNLISQQDYTYDFEGQVKTWAKFEPGQGFNSKDDVAHPCAAPTLGCSNERDFHSGDK